jgi:hypothetical protein
MKNSAAQFTTFCLLFPVERFFPANMFERKFFMGKKAPIQHVKILT